MKIFDKLDYDLLTIGKQPSQNTHKAKPSRTTDRHLAIG